MWVCIGGAHVQFYKLGVHIFFTCLVFCTNNRDLEKLKKEQEQLFASLLAGDEESHRYLKIPH